MTDAAHRINALYNELCGFARTNLDSAIRLGEMLFEQKSNMSHGEWLPWCKANLLFGKSSVCKYLKLFSDSEDGKFPPGGNLGVNEAYRILAAESKKHGNRSTDYREAEPLDGIISDLSEVEGEKFGTIYADPPWSYNNQGTRGNTGNHYDNLSVDEICEMPIAELAAEKAHLHLWTTNAFLFECPRIFEAWGFEFKSSFVWVKPQMGIGNYWRNSHEILLLGVRGGLTALDRGQMSWLECRRGAHSAKPDQVRDSIQKLSPGPRLELFGRRSVPGWVVFGNQVERLLA